MLQKGVLVVLENAVLFPLFLVLVRQFYVYNVSSVEILLSPIPFPSVDFSEVDPLLCLPSLLSTLKPVQLLQEFLVGVFIGHEFLHFGVDFFPEEVSVVSRLSLLLKGGQALVLGGDADSHLEFVELLSVVLDSHVHEFGGECFFARVPKAFHIQVIT